MIAVNTLVLVVQMFSAESCEGTHLDTPWHHETTIFSTDQSLCHDQNCYLENYELSSVCQTHS